MARKAILINARKKKEDYMKALASGKKPLLGTRVYNRCSRCGRNGGYMRKFDTCRICFRELANNGLLPGVTKSSW